MLHSTKLISLCFVLEVPFHKFVIKVTVLPMPNNFIHRHTTKKNLSPLETYSYPSQKPVVFTYLYMFGKSLLCVNLMY